jgi:hypothetical protein
MDINWGLFKFIASMKPSQNEQSLGEILVVPQLMIIQGNPPYLYPEMVRVLRLDHTSTMTMVKTLGTSGCSALIIDDVNVMCSA